MSTLLNNYNWALSRTPLKFLFVNAHIHDHSHTQFLGSPSKGTLKNVVSDCWHGAVSQLLLIVYLKATSGGIMSTRALNFAHAASIPWMAQTYILVLDINRPRLSLPLRTRPLSLHVFKQKLNDHLPRLWQKMLWDILSLRLILILNTECYSWPYDHTHFVFTVSYHVQHWPWKRAHLQLHSASSPEHVECWARLGPWDICRVGAVLHFNPWFGWVIAMMIMDTH